MRLLVVASRLVERSCQATAAAAGSPCLRCLTIAGTTTPSCLVSYNGKCRVGDYGCVVRQTSIDIGRYAGAVFNATNISCCLPMRLAKQPDKYNNNSNDMQLFSSTQLVLGVRCCCCCCGFLFRFSVIFCRLLALSSIHTYACVCLYLLNTLFLLLVATACTYGACLLMTFLLLL